jgi:hypothetical protein
MIALSPAAGVSNRRRARHSAVEAGYRAPPIQRGAAVPSEADR